MMTCVFKYYDIITFHVGDIKIVHLFWQNIVKNKLNTRKCSMHFSMYSKKVTSKGYNPTETPT